MYNDHLMPIISALEPSEYVTVHSFTVQYRLDDQQHLANNLLLLS